MDYKIFLIQIILVFSEVASAREEEEPNLFTSAELREEFAQDLAQDLDEIDEQLASLGNHLLKRKVFSICSSPQTMNHFVGAL